MMGVLHDASISVSASSVSRDATSGTASTGSSVSPAPLNTTPSLARVQEEPDLAPTPYLPPGSHGAAAVPPVSLSSWGVFDADVENIPGPFSLDAPFPNGVEPGRAPRAAEQPEELTHPGCHSRHDSLARTRCCSMCWLPAAAQYPSCACYHVSYCYVDYWKFV